MKLRWDWSEKDRFLAFTRVTNNEGIQTGNVPELGFSGGSRVCERRPTKRVIFISPYTVNYQKGCKVAQLEE